MDEFPEPRMQRQADPKGVHSEAWKQTLEDMKAIAADRRDEGWSVQTVMTTHTDTVSIDMGEHDEFGLFAIVPDNYADEFVEFYDEDSFTEYIAYGSNVEGFMYVVNEWIDPEGKRSIPIASRYDMTRANGLVESAKQEGVLYTHLNRVSGETLAVFEHEAYEPLISHPGR